MCGVRDSYLSDNELLKDYNAFRSYHDSVTGDLYKAVVLSALDLHFRHNIIMQMTKQGMRATRSRRTRWSSPGRCTRTTAGCGAR